MKLYLYDQHHETILAELDISSAEYDLEAIDTIIDFLDRNRVTNEYKRLIVAEDHKKVYDEESGLTIIKFKI